LQGEIKFHCCLKERGKRLRQSVIGAKVKNKKTKNLHEEGRSIGASKNTMSKDKQGKKMGTKRSRIQGRPPRFVGLGGLHVREPANNNVVKKKSKKRLL